MKHWLDCPKHGTRPNILSSYKNGLTIISAEMRDVEWAISHLYESISNNNIHFNSGASYPIKIIEFRETYNTLAFLIFLTHYEVPSPSRSRRRNQLLHRKDLLLSQHVKNKYGYAWDHAQANTRWLATLRPLWIILPTPFHWKNNTTK